MFLGKGPLLRKLQNLELGGRDVWEIPETGWEAWTENTPVHTYAACTENTPKYTENTTVYRKHMTGVFWCTDKEKIENSDPCICSILN